MAAPMDDDTRFAIVTNGAFVRRSCNISEPDRVTDLDRPQQAGGTAERSPYKAN